MYLQQLHHIWTLVEQLLELVEDDIVAVGTARVWSHCAQGKVETLAARVPLDGDRTAFGGTIAQHQFTVIV